MARVVMQLRAVAALRWPASVQIDRANVCNADLGSILLFQRRSYSAGPESGESSVVRRLWAKFATTIKLFMNGTKLLYADVKSLRDIQVTRGKRLAITDRAPLDKSEFPFTRTEVQFIYTTNKDLRKMLPTVVLFFIPILGYAIPFIAFMYPQRMLSSHFLSEEGRRKLSQAGVSSSAEQLRLLAEYIRTHEQKNFFGEILKEDTSSLKFKDVYHKVSNHPDPSFKLDYLSKKHMFHLGWQWGTLPWLSLWLPFSRLQRHMNYVFVSDWLIRLEGGVEGLADDEVMRACLERRICPSMDCDISSLRQKLTTWLKFTTYFEVCPPSLIAHLPLVLHKLQL